MPIYERAVDRGARRGRFLVGRTSSELQMARREAAISQRELGRLLRVSHSKVGRALRGEPDQMTIEFAARMASILGLQLSVTLHADGDPVRDAAHLALISRFHRRVADTFRWRTEVTIPAAGDHRSADIVLTGPGFEILVEAETRLDDLQAVERKLAAKQRDLGIGRAILLVADTRHDRAVIARHPELRDRFPVSTRRCLASLSHGRDPGGDSLVVL